MERRSLESGDQTRGGVVQNLLVSGIRLSASADQVGTTLDSVTDFWRPAATPLT